MAAKKKTNVPAGESPEERFVRVATLKTNSILKSLRTLSKLRGSKAKSTQAQREAIQDAISTALDDVIEQMAGKVVETTGFKL